MIDQLLKVGIIGLGVGESHISGYHQHPACLVTKICDFIPEVADVAKRKYPDIEVTMNASDVLTDSDIDVVSIASYDHAHFAQIVEGITHKKHLFIEKPIVTNEQEALVVWNLLRENPEIVISSNLVMRKMERFTDLKKRLSNGDFGELSFINASYNYGRLNKIIHGWRGSSEDYSIVTGGGIHMIDLIQWLTNDEVEEVFAAGNNIHTKEFSINKSDLVTCILKFRSGLIANMTCNFGCVMPHYHQIEIFGTQQTFVNGMDEAMLFSERDVKNGEFNYLVNKPDFPEYSGKAILDTNYATLSKGVHIHEFIDAIINKHQPSIDRKQIFKSMSVCFAIERSVVSGKLEKVEYYN